MENSNLHTIFKMVEVGALPPFQLSGIPLFRLLKTSSFPITTADWTGSPHIAAFFAMENPASDAEYVSVYVFWEYTTGGKISDRSKPAIHGLGPNVRSHRRHFLQQSRYTICIAMPDDNWIYSKHEDVVAREETGQDRLWKINIPASARVDFLKRLHKMNIDSFSLFGTEDSLVATIAADIFTLNPKSND